MVCLGEGGLGAAFRRMYTNAAMVVAAKTTSRMTRSSYNPLPLFGGGVITFAHRDDTHITQVCEQMM